MKGFSTVELVNGLMVGALVKGLCTVACHVTEAALV